jgi:hypothetical protein
MNKVVITENVFKGLGILQSQIPAVVAKALRAGATELTKQTKKNLRASNFKSKDMTKGIRYKVDKDYLEAKVHIMGHPLLRIFEKGTYKSGIRRTKKGYSRGSIKPHSFFATAKGNMSGVRDKIFKKLDEEINKLK